MDRFLMDWQAEEDPWEQWYEEESNCGKIDPLDFLTFQDNDQ